MRRQKPYIIIIIIIFWSIIFYNPSISTGIDKSGVKPSVISLPSGPGSIEGLGESFEPNLNNGTYEYSFSVKLPPAVNGHMLSVTLSYDTGNGNSPFGLGWKLNTPYIQRQTDKGLPEYKNSDTFIYHNGEELVSLSDGSFRTEVETDFNYFKPKDSGWEMKTRNGSSYLFGTYPKADDEISKSRIYRGNNSSFAETFCWYLNEAIDTNGNKIKYYYSNYDDSPGYLYCTEIRYSIFGNNYKSVVFEYTPREDQITNYHSRFPITIGRRCTGIRVYSVIDNIYNLVRRYELTYDHNKDDQGERLHAFSLLSMITQYDFNEQGNNYLPPLSFKYTLFNLLETKPIALQTPSNFISTLRENTLEIADINGDSLVDFIYSPVDSEENSHMYYLNTGNSCLSYGENFIYSPAGVSLAQDEVTLADYNGDGLCDLIVKRSFDNGFGYYPNKSKFNKDLKEEEIKWGENKVLYINNPPFKLDDKNVQMLDLDGDKKTDFIYNHGIGFQYFYNRTKYMHQEGSYWEKSEIIPWDDNRLGDMTSADVAFSIFDGIKKKKNPYLHLGDMNGDRLQDLIKLTINSNKLSICYWPNKGWGEWDKRVYMRGNEDISLDIGSGNIDDITIFDINADGLCDIVQVDMNLLYYWINRGDGTYSIRYKVTDMPDYTPGNTILRQADLNGNGTVDLLWENMNGPKLQYYDFIDDTKPNLLSTIDNGLGKQTHIKYKISTDYYIEANEKQNPWLNRIPFPVYVVERLLTTPNLDIDQDGNIDEYITKFTYHDAFYDSFEKEFRGFRFVKQVERGDSHYPTTTMRFCFHTGAPDGKDNDNDDKTDEWNEGSGWEDEHLKGALLWSEIIDNEGCIQDKDIMSPDVFVYSRIHNTWEIKNIHTPYKGNSSITFTTQNEKSIVFPHITKSITEIIEKTPSEKKILETEYEYDFFGNITFEKNYGIQNNTSIDDELFIRTDYITNQDAIDKWIINKPYRTLKTDEHNSFVSVSLYYYDGINSSWDTFNVCSLGTIGMNGNLTMQEDRVYEDGRYIKSVRNLFDKYGNIISIKDANEHIKEIEYDSLFHTLPIKVILYQDSNKSPLEISAQYDQVLSVINQYTNFNGHITSYRHDSFARITKIIQPYDREPFDDDEYPTVQFSYIPADPLNGLIYEYDSKGNLTIKKTLHQPLVSTIITKNREEQGTPGTFDSFSFIDGMARTLAEIDEGDEPGLFVVNNASIFSRQGFLQKSFLPYYIRLSFDSIPIYTPPSSNNPNLAYIEKFYDVLGRDIKIINPEDAQGEKHFREIKYYPLEVIIYDEEDTESIGTIHHNTPTISLYDGLERLIELKETNKDDQGLSIYTTHYTWNLLNKLIERRDNHNNVKRYFYDALGHTVKIEDPDKGQMILEYDDVGNLIRTIDNKNQIIGYEFDALNRLVLEDYGDDRFSGGDSEVSYFYDQPAPEHIDEQKNLKGYFSYVYDQSGAEYNSYDARGNNTLIIKRINDPELSSLGYKEFRNIHIYDALDRVKRSYYPDNEYIDFIYNNRSLIKQVPHLIEDITYKASGKIDQFKYGNGIISKYDYDPRQRVINLQTAKTENNIMQDQKYTYDGIGNITSIIDQRKNISSESPQNRTQNFIYDDLYRLTTASGMGYGKINYKYDSIGNMTNKNSPIAGQPGHIADSLINLGNMIIGKNNDTFNKTKKEIGIPGPHAITQTENGFVYEYDENGNMIKKSDTVNNKEILYKYDIKDRIVSIRKDNEGIYADYVYDYDNQRIIKKVNKEGIAEKTYYINAGYEIRNGESLKYFSFLNKRLALIKGSLEDNLKATQTIQLSEGWNLVSLHVEPDNPLIASIISNLSNVEIQLFSYDRQKNEYKEYSKTRKDFTNLHAKEGYMIWVDQPCSLIVSGKPTQWGVDIKEGWNLTGIPLTGQYDISSFCNSNIFENNDKTIWGLSNNKTIDGQIDWLYYSNFINEPNFPNDLSTLDQGKAYWINAQEDTYIKGVRLDNYKVFYITDHLGTSTMATDIDGNILEIIEYYPYGGIRYHEKREDISYYKFTGKELDEESNLYYFGARYYDPVVCRFISIDPVEPPLYDPQSYNPYAYCRNNPINYVDPDGRFADPFTVSCLAKTALVIGAKIWGVFKTFKMINKLAKKIAQKQAKTEEQKAAIEKKYKKNEVVADWTKKNVKDIQKFQFKKITTLLPLGLSENKMVIGKAGIKGAQNESDKMNYLMNVKEDFNNLKNELSRIDSKTQNIDQLTTSDSVDTSPDGKDKPSGGSGGGLGNSRNNSSSGARGTGDNSSTNSDTSAPSGDPSSPTNQGESQTGQSSDGNNSTGDSNGSDTGSNGSDNSGVGGGGSNGGL